MRAFTVLLALVATPFLAGVSQQKTNNGKGHDAAHCAKRAVQRPGQDINKCEPATQPPVDPPAGNPPPVVDPPAGDPPPVVDPPAGDPPPVVEPPPTSGGACANSQMTGGTSTIHGQVFVDQGPSYSLLGGWCVELKDAATGAVLASMLSSATALNGDGDNYVFTGVPVGNYLVCEIPESGWHQSFPTSGPACSPNPGYAVPIPADGSDAPFIWFGNLTP